MKKTLLTLLALGCCAMGAGDSAITLSSTHEGNYNSTMHGFYLSLSSGELKAPDGVSLTTTAVLESLEVGSGAGTGRGVTYGFLVLGYNDGTVLGVSDVHTTSNDPLTFNFSTLTGGDLILSTADTYRFVAVQKDVVEKVQSSSDTYIFNGGKNGLSYATEGNTITITGGLAAPGMRFYYDTSALADDCCGISTSAINAGSGTYSPIVNASIRLIPEPTTATLSLLALAGPARSHLMPNL